MSSSADTPERARRGRAARALLACLLLASCAAGASAQARLHLNDGRSIEAEEVWEDAQGVWYSRGRVTTLLDRSRVRRVERPAGPEEAKGDGGAGEGKAAGSRPAGPAREDLPAQAPTPAPLWIHLAGGAKVQVEEVTEASDGYWYRRGFVSMFLDRARVERIEREDPAAGAAPAASAAFRDFGWTTGRPHLDRIIRENGARHGVDPYLIFCVMEQESQFNQRAVSPKGARGLMQLMPGTARRFGVRDPHDPAQGVSGGTRYLRELLQMFGGRVDLALASYNAGEGAVMRYGKTVPPYRETRDYVRRISSRYGRGPHADLPGRKTGAGKSPPDLQ